MKNYLLRILTAFSLLGFFLISVGAKESAARVSVDIRIAPPPPYVIQAPPPVVVIPGTYVYEIPNAGATILFYNGYWYRPYAGNWFWAYSYNGSWQYLPPSAVPPQIAGLPPNYYIVPPGYPVIPYAEFRANWATWERERHWDHDRYWRERHAWDGGRREWREGRPGRPEEREHGHGRRG